MIWGLGFVAQRYGMEYVGPFLFAGARFILGALTLVIVLLASGWLTRRRLRRQMGAPGSGKGSADRKDGRSNLNGRPDPAALLTADQHEGEQPSLAWVFPSAHLIKGGVLCGLAILLGGSLQAAGMVYTPAAKAGFLTALYIVLVPILGILIKQKTHWNSWVAVIIAAVGLYFLSITNGLAIQLGDGILIISAFFWAAHILLIDHYVADLEMREVLKLCVVQFITAGVLGFVCMPFFDHFFVQTVLNWPALSMALVPILYAGVISTGLAFTLQAIGQKGLNPTAAALIMSLEAVFSVIGGMLILGEVLTVREAVGCGLMFVAVVLAQLRSQAGARDRLA